MMTRFDRYTLTRMATNFVLLFALFFLLATSIDVILHMDDFTAAARASGGDLASGISIAASVVWLIIEFSLPRAPMFFAWFYGLIAVAAMGFTLTQMRQERELVALMSAGISLWRVSVPIIVVVIGLTGVQAINQEWLLPRLAPLVLRDHHNIGDSTISSFPVRFLQDGSGSLFQASSFDPVSMEITDLTFIERDERGRATRRTSAVSAAWDVEGTSWTLTEGTSRTIDDAGMISPPEPRAAVATDLSPQRLLAHQHGQYGSMLSMGQLGQAIDGSDSRQVDTLRRFRVSRFSLPLINILVVILALPFFLRRQPGNAVRPALLCALVTIPVALISTVMAVAPMPGLTPLISGFLPVVLLLPLALGAMGLVRS